MIAANFSSKPFVSSMLPITMTPSTIKSRLR
jgi:hypothetical protein